MTSYAIFNNSFFATKPWWMPSKLYRVIYDRSNPRTKEYMLKLLAAKFPEAKVIDVVNLPFQIDHVILLYPDAIGLGWGAIEKTCMSRIKNITVLNGRKRIFNLAFKIHLSLTLKRILEITLIPELIFVPILLALAFSLAIKDKLVGYSR